MIKEIVITNRFMFNYGLVKREFLKTACGHPDQGGQHELLVVGYVDNSHLNKWGMN